MLDASGETIYGYDSRDQLISKATPQGTLGYSHDAAGNVESINTNTPDGASMTYTYDDLNRLDTVTGTNNQVIEYGYDEVGNLQHVALPNGVSTGYGYNAVNRLTTLTHFRAGQTIASYDYGLHATGHRRAVFENGGRTAAYDYDLLWRLKQESITGDPAGRNGQVSYNLDPVGNRLSRTSTVAGLASQSFGYDASDRVNGDTYDANGNTTTAPVSQPPGSAGAAPEPIRGTDSYDSQDRLTSRAGVGGAVQVLYNGDGHKVQESVTQYGITTVTTYLVDELNPTGYAQVVEEKTNGVLTRVYTYGHDLLSQDALVGNDWHLSYYGYDGHGSVRFLTNELGLATDTYDYDAFGTLLAIGGTSPNRYLYTGEQYDNALGLYYLRARYMSAASGRFWNADSYEGSNGDPANLHRYLYCANDPVNWIDPSGYWSLSDLSATQKIALSVGAIGAVRGGYGAYRHGADVLQGAVSGFAAGYLATFAIIKWPPSALLILPAGLIMTAEEFYRNITEGKWDLVGIDIALLVSGPRLTRYASEIRSVESLPPKTLPGPTLPEKIADTFTDSAYVNRQLATDTSFFKYHGVDNRTGRKFSWVTDQKYSSEAELRRALAIREDWGVSITRVSEFNVPKGTWISEGTAASQGAGFPGGAYQGVIQNLPRSWITRTNKAFR